MIIHIFIDISQRIKWLSEIFLSLCDSCLMVVLFIILLQFLYLGNGSVFLFSISFEVLFSVTLGVGLTKHRNVTFKGKSFGLMRKQTFKILLLVPLFDEFLHPLSDGWVACLRVPEVEYVEVEDVIRGGFGLESLENAGCLLVKSLPQHVIEEERLHKLNCVLYQLLTVLLVQESVQNTQVGHVLLLSVAGVGETWQSFLQEMLRG